MSRRVPRKGRRKTRSGRPQDKKTWIERALLTAVSGIRKKWFRKVAAVTGAVTVVITLASVPSLFPRVSVSPGVFLNSLNPLDTIFWLSNDGVLSIRNIEYKYDILHYDVDGGGRIILHGDRNITFVDSSVETIPELRPAQKTSLRCHSPFKVPDMRVQQCEVEVAVFFRWFGWPFERRFRYEAVRDRNNEWQWTDRAGSEQY